ncbi:MAG: NAD-dependent epimerase/dehydratase family protein [Candidatus Eisenbacteria bacterium]|nr:NAD-dependent epimerase/dehydratase family protein [Candidatus Eisenbacteria bacterium]
MKADPTGKPVLVTGGAGFIGSHLVEALVARGHEVRVLDDLSTGRRENLASVLASGRVELIVAQVQDQERLRAAIEGCRTIYHLAASVGVGAVTQHPLECLKNNADGFQSLFHAIEAVGSQGGRSASGGPAAGGSGAFDRVVVFSSSEVYGKSTAPALREDDDLHLGPTHVPRWSYAAAKAFGEFLALTTHREQGLPVTIIRCFNTVGPRQLPTYGMVLPRFVAQARRGEPLTVYGDGAQTRCFSFVEDVVNGVLDLAAHPGADGQVFNIGSDEETSVLSLAERVIALTGSSSDIRFIPYSDVYGGDVADIQRRVPDLSRIRGLIGYAPRTRLDGILRATLETQIAADLPVGR